MFIFSLLTSLTVLSELIFVPNGLLTLAFCLSGQESCSAMATSDAAPVGDKIEAGLKAKLDKGETANIMISFGDTSAVLEKVTKSLPADASRGDRATAVNKALEAYRDESQGGVVKILKDRNVEFNQLWISNQISVKGANGELANAIAEDPKVVAIKEEQVAYLQGS